MTARRRSMLAALQLRGLSARTPEMDVRAVRQLAHHVNPSPDPITEDERRQSFLPLQTVRQSSRRATTMARCGSTFVCAPTRNRAGTTLTVVRPPREQQRPGIVSRTEGREICRPVRWLPYRPCLTTLDAGGWRRQAGTPRRVTALERARLRLQVRHGNGGTARDVPRPQRPLARLRQDGRTPRPPRRMFPAPGRGRLPAPTATTPLPQSRLQEAVRDARTARGGNTRAGVHPRRHSWATPRLDAGGTLRRMHDDRGHHAPPTTAV